MCIRDRPQIVELTYAGQEIEITETSVGFFNERQKVKVTLDCLLYTSGAARSRFQKIFVVYCQA